MASSFSPWWSAKTARSRQWRYWSKNSFKYREKRTVLQSRCHGGELSAEGGQRSSSALELSKLAGTAFRDTGRCDQALRRFQCWALEVGHGMAENGSFRLCGGQPLKLRPCHHTKRWHGILMPCRRRVSSRWCREISYTNNSGCAHVYFSLFRRSYGVGTPVPTNQKPVIATKPW